MTDKGKRTQLNNKGFSLVELIVVMVIMVLLATALIVSFVNSSDQKVKASTNVVANYLKDVLNYNMTKGTSDFTITYDAKNERYEVDDGQGHSEKLSSGIKVSYNVGGTNYQINDSNDVFSFSFSRANGSYEAIKKGSGTGSLADSIDITCNDYGKTIILYNKTGEYEIEDLQM